MRIQIKILGDKREDTTLVRMKPSSKMEIENKKIIARETRNNSHKCRLKKFENIFYLT